MLASLRQPKRIPVEQRRVAIDDSDEEDRRPFEQHPPASVEQRGESGPQTPPYPSRRDGWLTRRRTMLGFRRFRHHSIGHEPQGLRATRRSSDPIPGRKESSTASSRSATYGEAAARKGATTKNVRHDSTRNPASTVSAMSRSRVNRLMCWAT